MTTYENFKFDVDADGIALVTWDMPGRSMNVLSQSSMADMAAIIEKIMSDDAIKGAVLTSGKDAFCAGADLSMMGGQAGGGSGGGSQEERVKAMYEGNLKFNMLLRSLETCGKPVVAAINGTALGGGLEVTLACHYRVASDNPKTQIGLPEAKVGLLPGGGGTQRLPRLIGAQAALPLILQGTSLDPQKALKAGIVHKVVPAAELIAAAKAWLKEGLAQPKVKLGKKGPEVYAIAIQPWDREGYKVPGGDPHSKGGGQVFTIGNATLHKQTHGNFPAQKFIMSCVYEGLQVPIEAGLRIETRYFTKLLMDPRSKAMIRSLFLSMQELAKGARRPAGIAPFQVKKLGILGAGMMGAGIAYVSAQAGMEVVLLDTDQANAEKGKAYSEKLLAKALERGKTTQEKADKLLGLIKPTTNYDDLKGADLVIEAVFESRDIKAEVTKKAEPMLAAGGIYGSNTSTLPITGLAEAAAKPDNFIGIHFFSPVDKMQLVEIIMGKKTSDETLAKAMDYVKQIRKTPIVVNDSRGFYTSRCFGTYVGEGLAMLGEGVPPAMIENVGRMTSMPMAPLALNDEVSLDLAYKVREQTKKDLGDKYVGSPADDLVKKMVVDLGRVGKKAGKGFYDYPADGKKKLWPGLADLVGKAQNPDDLDVQELKNRFLYIQALEAARCFEEGVVTDVRDADVGAILGWGFAPWAGGPLSLIDMVGTAAFVEACDKLAQKYGPRFTPSKLLRDMASKGETFYGRFAPNKEKAAA
ncbi:3-hydroxyacyl-CoA dehydrogenase NAD-binding domain-containing protein [Parvibaculum sp.]|uniref:3-hydroxyacyl-CoA dehydrogenase NAD-binding domain-containing protein n=1 Tax=Parvibaculum sp. TaxID=2024848 RepID=UPI001DB5066B|nr:3-hydroxyacyl-CoA dehydrogenase NAD-binding domain-containing protein [Parvibaculum sp.]MBX3490234.1 enoyl-CoA hydratase/isomerase family protein [Parvibaculum sp.]MCW5729085.1 enoyl-CoA hydratase/isomerase family protein [Parvibaculum sp.]